MILSKILELKRKEIQELKTRFPVREFEEALRRLRKEPRDFKKAISNPHNINIIAEIKRKSPSKGMISNDFKPDVIARQYELGTAAAISVLTEFHYFGGRPSFLKTVRRVTTKPILRKDFILDSIQIYEAALLSADAVLLIASLLTDAELKKLIRKCHELGLDALVEVHMQEDLDKAIKCGAKIIGVNNRNLQTLEINPKVAENLARNIPPSAVKVVESGIQSHKEIMHYKSLGFTAFLVGASLMTSENITEKLKELKGVRR